MRRGDLLNHVQELVEGHWHREPHVAESIVECEAFETFAMLLSRAGDGDPDGVTAHFAYVARSLSDSQLDWLAGDGPNDPPETPAAFLAGKLNELTA